MLHDHLRSANEDAELRLRHLHIISVLDYGFDNARSITAYAGAKRLLVQVSQALAYLHRRGIIRRCD